MQKQESNIRNETAEIANFYFKFPIISLCKLKAAIATRVLIRLKKNLFTASEEKIFNDFFLENLPF